MTWLLWDWPSCLGFSTDTQPPPEVAKHILRVVLFFLSLLSKKKRGRLAPKTAMLSFLCVRRKKAEMRWVSGKEPRFSVLSSCGCTERCALPGALASCADLGLLSAFNADASAS